MSNLVFQQAQDHVESFVTKTNDAMAEHREAMDCWNCEAVIQMGIDAFEWLQRADQGMHEAVYAGAAVPDEEFEALKSLYREWHDKTTLVKAWAQRVISNSFALDNFQKLLESDREVAAVVRSFDKQSGLTDAMRGLRDEAVKEHDRGQTAPFFSGEQQND